MVVGKPYIHFKVNNEPIEEVVDYNYTWATTVETNRGPINTPVYISSAAQAQTIFGVDMRPYFAQSPNSLIMVRVASATEANTPAQGIFNFNLDEDITIFRAGQPTITLINKEKQGTQIVDKEYTFPLFYTIKNGVYVPVIPHRNSEGILIPESYIDSWHNNGRVITAEEAEADAAKDVATSEQQAAADYDPSLYKQGLVASNVYDASSVYEFLTPEKYVIPKIMTTADGTTTKTPLFNIKSKYEGDYNISVSCYPAKNQPDYIDNPGYTIAISDPKVGTLRIANGYDVHKIVNRINDKNLDVVAETTNAGEALHQAMHSYPQPADTETIVVGAAYNTFSGPSSFELITSTCNNGTYLIAGEKNNSITYLSEAEYNALQSPEKPSNMSQVEYDNIRNTVKIVNYSINLETIGAATLIGGNNGEWDAAKGRIPAKYQGEAHANGLKALQRIRLAGVFCMYGEDNIVREYLEHGINTYEPEKGMNNNETCKWRTILIGANSNDRTDLTALASKAAALNDQHVLLLGQGLIDANMTGIAATMSTKEKQNYGLVSDHHLLPYECTQYIAGLRSKLNYGESIFGGQGRKRIRSVSTKPADLEIAPLLDYEIEYTWEPNYYVRLNEAGVLTFTEEYGNITLTDGVTTIQGREEEDEEGVMNILKYAQNAVYDVCLPYIGRNIDADIENSITTDIERVLEDMKSIDQTLVDTDEYKAYTASVSLSSRRNQLLGRIYVYLTICPVHAVRQIEVEMTVQ